MIIVDRQALTEALEHLIELARAGEEGVGLLSGPLAAPVRRASGLLTNVTVEYWTPLRNVSEFPRLRYEVDPIELVAAYDRLEGEGLRPYVQVHSHVRGGPVPSPTDIRYATNPALLHMIVDLEPSRPLPVLWRINPDAAATVMGSCERVRFQTADLGFQEHAPTDLTHGVTDP